MLDPSVVLVRTADQQLFTAQIVHAPADQRLGNIETGTELAGGVDRGIVGQKNQNIQFVGRKSFLLVFLLSEQFMLIHWIKLIKIELILQNC